MTIGLSYFVIGKLPVREKGETEGISWSRRSLFSLNPGLFSNEKNSRFLKLKPPILFLYLDSNTETVFDFVNAFQLYGVWLPE